MAEPIPLPGRPGRPGQQLPDPSAQDDARFGMSPGPAEQAADERQRLLATLTRDVTARRDLADVLATTLAGLRRLVAFGGGSIQLLDDDGWIRVAAADPAAADELYALRIPLGSTVAGRIILTERPIYLPDIAADPGPGRSAPPPKENLSPQGVRSYFGAPLMAEGRAIGVLQLDSPEPQAWDDTERTLLVCVAPVVAAAIQNSRAHARVTAAELSSRRTADRWREILGILETDVDGSVGSLVELCDQVPAMRAHVERVAAAVGRLRAVVREADAQVEDDPAIASVDLRTASPTQV